MDVLDVLVHSVIALICCHFSRIIPRSPNVFIFLDHSKPALTEEYYEVSVNVRNDEATPISNVRITLTLPSELLQPAGELCFAVVSLCI